MHNSLRKPCVSVLQITGAQSAASLWMSQIRTPGATAPIAPIALHDRRSPCNIQTTAACEHPTHSAASHVVLQTESKAAMTVCTSCAGGAGFIASHVAIRLVREYPQYKVRRRVGCLLMC